MAEFNEEMQGFEDSNASCSGNTGSSSSNIPEFMRKPPFQKGIVGLVWNMMLVGVIGCAWFFYGCYLIIPKTINFIKGLFKK